MTEYRYVVRGKYDSLKDRVAHTTLACFGLRNAIAVHRKPLQIIRVMGVREHICKDRVDSCEVVCPVHGSPCELSSKSNHGNVSNHRHFGPDGMCKWYGDPSPDPWVPHESGGVFWVDRPWEGVPRQGNIAK
jgi:hypothetical protein